MHSPITATSSTSKVEVFQPIVDALTELGLTDPDPTVERASVGVWCAFQSAVALEVNHHLDWIDDPGATQETTVRRVLASIGGPLRPPRPSVDASTAG